jgi:hypothetical protein
MRRQVLPTALEEEEGNEKKFALNSSRKHNKEKKYASPASVSIAQALVTHMIHLI